MNVAARLEQAAEPGEVLIGEATLRARRVTRSRSSEVEPLELKGKTRAGRRLSGSSRSATAPERSPRIALRRPRARAAALAEAWERALAQHALRARHGRRRAGVGKSRLVAEALGTIEARVVARPLPALRRGDHVLARRRGGEAARRAAVRSGRGRGDPLAPRRERTGRRADEIAWAFRKLLEEQAPLVVVLDDIQWGEETFLDLVETSALLSAARRSCSSAWPVRSCSSAVRAGRASSRLEPLPDEEADALIGDRGLG